MVTDFAETTALAEMRAIAKQKGDRKGRPYGSDMRHAMFASSLHVETWRATSQSNGDANADGARRCGTQTGHAPSLQREMNNQSE
jgi:hypothetical protein